MHPYTKALAICLRFSKILDKKNMTQIKNCCVTASQPIESSLLAVHFISLACPRMLSRYAVLKKEPVIA